MRFTHVACILFTLALVGSSSQADDKPQLWLYYPTNFLVDKNLDKAQKTWERAAAAGYTHVLIADSKFARLATLDSRYFKNCARAKEIAAGLKLQLVPAMFSVGYSNDLLSNDPNLAEGVPVRDQPFVVKHGIADLVADPAIHFGKVNYHDSNITVEKKLATVTAAKGNARLIFHLTVPEFRCYHISVKIQTEDLKSHPEIHVRGKDRDLQWQNLAVAPTQDWKQYDVVFDSLDHTDINVYLGIWGEVKGSMQWKDWSIEEVGLLNVLRRPGAPCAVKEEDTGKVLTEGVDYEPIVDPKTGRTPYAGEYEAYHKPPVIHAKLADGTKLRVSWYYPPIVYDGQVAACISEPKTKALLADQAKRMKELWGVPLYMMSHDEFRVADWDESCESTKLTPGQLLAANLRECTDLLRPQQAAVWSDMFDPYHNAVKGPYYLVNGPWTDSWEGLAKDVLVVNWNHGKRDESLKFFADRGNPQLVAGYYDSDLSHLSEWMESAKKVKGVVGYMYTTWRGDYSAMEKFAKIVESGK